MSKHPVCRLIFWKLSLRLELRTLAGYCAFPHHTRLSEAFLLPNPTKIVCLLVISFYVLRILIILSCLTS
jgi:hypothetical protein